MRHRSHSEVGFSLIELMIAMVLTLIVSGAIYGLIAAGQTAFRREPEVAELTQSLRAAMSTLQEDVEGAGLGFSTFTQVFTNNLDNVPPGVPGPQAQFSVLAGNDGQYADQLELITTDAQCPGVRVCQAPGGGAGFIVDSPVDFPTCMRAPNRLMALVGTVGTAAPAFFIGEPAAPIPAPGPACALSPPGALLGVQVDLPNTNGPAEWHPALLPAPLSTIAPARVIRYQVALSGDPLDTAPCLWRSETGGRLGPAYATVTDPPSAAWQLIARGIEDMQVQYMDGNGVFADVPGVIVVPPPPVVPGAGIPIIRRLRVTLSARSTALNMTGTVPAAANAAALPVALRAQIAAEMSPRAALLWLQQIGDWK
jgi:prepilin-type N-terminal cleavage/methylation domain-containing protein